MRSFREKHEKNSENAMRKPPMDDCGAKKAVSIPEEQIRPCRDKRNAAGQGAAPQLKHPAHHGGCFLVDHQPVPVLLALAVAVGRVGGDVYWPLRILAWRTDFTLLERSFQW